MFLRPQVGPQGFPLPVLVQPFGLVLQPYFRLFRFLARVLGFPNFL